jgi:DNA repair protein SbcD/Mre11
MTRPKGVRAMKILHTADWHLNDRLGGHDRTQHLRTRVEQIAQICQDQSIDVLTIAGDIFSEQADVDQVAASFQHLRLTFRAFFQRSGTILAITGNHDQDGRVRRFIELARAGMDIAEPPRRPGDYFIPGKMYLADAMFFGRLRDPAGMDVQFTLLPFPSHGRTLYGDEQATTSEELNRPIAQRISDWIRSLRHDPRFDTALRTVLVAHMSVTGADLSRGRFTLNEQNDVIADAGDLPTGWDYVALGHVHKPQCIHGLAHVRYAGSLDRLDFGERHEDKGVVFVDIGPDGRRADPLFIPIEPTTLVDVRVADANVARQQIEAQVPDPQSSLVRVFVEPTAAVDGGGTVDRAIREALPFVTSIDWQQPTLEGSGTGQQINVKATVRETVADYLHGKINENDPQRAALIELAESFLNSEGQR